MVRYRRSTVATVMALLLTGALAAPTIAQTGPYQPEEPPREEPAPEEEPAAEEPAVEGEVIEAPGEPAAEEPAVEGEVIEAPGEPEVDVEEEPIEVRGATLVRTGSDTLLLVTAGLLALGVGVTMILRSRRRGTPEV